MYAKALLAVSGLVAMVAAVPLAPQHHQHHPAFDKRAIVWETAIHEVVVTVPVTKTIWIEPGQTPPVQPTQEAPAPSSTLEVKQSPVAPSSSPAAAALAFSKQPELSPSEPVLAPTSSSIVVPVAVPTTSSSVYAPPAPAPTTSTTPVVVAPAPSSTTAEAAPATTSEASNASDGAGSTSNSAGMKSGMAAAGTSYTGDLTYYEPGLGACGIESTVSQPIVAISHVIFDAYNTGNPNDNPLCGKSVTITGKDGSPYTATIVDRCVGCDEQSLDLSPDFFNIVTDNGNGRVKNMHWHFD